MGFAHGASVVNASGATPGDVNVRVHLSVVTAMIETSTVPYVVEEGDLAQLLDVDGVPTTDNGPTELETASAAEQYLMSFQQDG
ncbi:hypothetical protein [Methylocystis echinoides]|uniref:Uncharacterized protein n=1 Tax=Methylocystis echinoides TaxID=29468 RepID=A0A9W6GYN7_9HYPH|nr:hypothetical protein [Methylocystis echinoides]GLI95250.1 hypothetical protein LMG27198_42420 [Methylocystis echinoides]